VGAGEDATLGLDSQLLCSCRPDTSSRHQTLPPLLVASGRRRRRDRDGNVDGLLVRGKVGLLGLAVVFEQVLDGLQLGMRPYEQGTAPELVDPRVSAHHRLGVLHRSRLRFRHVRGEVLDPLAVCLLRRSAQSRKLLAEVPAVGRVQVTHHLLRPTCGVNVGQKVSSNLHKSRSHNQATGSPNAHCRCRTDET